MQDELFFSDHEVRTFLYEVFKYFLSENAFSSDNGKIQKDEHFSFYFLCRFSVFLKDSYSMFSLRENLS